MSISTVISRGVPGPVNVIIFPLMLFISIPARQADGAVRGNGGFSLGGKMLGFFLSFGGAEQTGSIAPGVGGFSILSKSGGEAPLPGEVPGGVPEPEFSSDDVPLSEASWASGEFRGLSKIEDSPEFSSID